MTETSIALQTMFFKYTHLPIGGKEITCPYWMNKIKKGKIGPSGGKGTPEQIIKAVEFAAEKEGFDLINATLEQILEFMKRKHIGIDCSGFVFWMLNAFDLEKGGDGIANNIPGSQGKFLFARANVVMLTDEGVSVPVDLKEVRVGDMIQLRGRKHIAIVIEITKENGVLSKIRYCHSSGLTGNEGVHSSLIKISKPNETIKEQIWEEKTKDGKNYSSCLFEEFGDGLKRLRIFNA